MTPARI